MKENFLFIISGPSGVGKTTIAKHLLSKYDNLTKSISVTTREQRTNEIDGLDYYFVDVNKYNEYINNNGLLENATIFGNYYGTPKHVVEKAIKNGNNVIFDIDKNGYNQIMECDEFDIVSVFLIPEAIEVLEQRLTARGETEENITIRIGKAKDEIANSFDYNYIVINKDLYKTCDIVDSIYQAECIKRNKKNILNFINNNLLS